MGCYNQKTLTRLSRKARRFIKSTDKFLIHDLRPGGIYDGIWCRDASYILKDWLLSGRTEQALNEIHSIWSYQIEERNDGRKLIYGRGSPEMDFMPVISNDKTWRRFQGSLPTSIFQENNIMEVFGKNPDIDSTALMISTTSWILARLLQKRGNNKSVVSANSQSNKSSSSGGHSLLSIIGLTDFLVPKMNKAVSYLVSRDIDNDGLLEQDHNEDWMDSVMRRGKILYSNATWILALENYSNLLREFDMTKNDNHEQKKINGTIERLDRILQKAVQAIEEGLWSDEDGCYVDLQEYETHIGGPYRTVTQDVVLYLMANIDRIRKQEVFADKRKINSRGNLDLYRRAISTLNVIKERIWKKGKWPLVTEVELKKTGPWLLKPYQYHNYTFWPWATALEIMARSMFKQIKECDLLFSHLASEKGESYESALYEWINPITDEGQGAYPFRTGISSVRVALFGILEENM
jgi:glycogen debranching enzyme